MRYLISFTCDLVNFNPFLWKCLATLNRYESSVKCSWVKWCTNGYLCGVSVAANSHKKRKQNHRCKSKQTTKKGKKGKDTNSECKHIPFYRHSKIHTQHNRHRRWKTKQNKTFVSWLPNHSNCFDPCSSLACSYFYSYFCFCWVCVACCQLGSFIHVNLIVIGIISNDIGSKFGDYNAMLCKNDRKDKNNTKMDEKSIKIL